MGCVEGCAALTEYPQIKYKDRGAQHDCTQVKRKHRASQHVCAGKTRRFHSCNGYELPGTDLAYAASVLIWRMLRRGASAHSGATPTRGRPIARCLRPLCHPFNTTTHVVYATCLHALDATFGSTIRIVRQSSCQSACCDVTVVTQRVLSARRCRIVGSGVAPCC
eukprot:1929486-Rhodomonas_salina.1